MDFKNSRLRNHQLFINSKVLQSYYVLIEEVTRVVRTDRRIKVN
ncbi:MAG: hypothetical protein ACRCWG_05095 [Sarcina sp.]